MSMHLSSQQLDEALAGHPTQVTAQHLGQCAGCEQELATMSDVLGDLRLHAAHVADRHQRMAATRGRLRVPRMAWGLAAAALFLSVGAPLAVHYSEPSHGAVQVAPAAPTISDDALLSSVQNDLSSSVAEPLLPLAANTSSATDTSSSSTNKLIPN